MIKFWDRAELLFCLLSVFISVKPAGYQLFYKHLLQQKLLLCMYHLFYVSINNQPKAAWEKFQIRAGLLILVIYCL